MSNVFHYTLLGWQFAYYTSEMIVDALPITNSQPNLLNLPTLLPRLKQPLQNLQILQRLDRTLLCLHNPLLHRLSPRNNLLSHPNRKLKLLCLLHLLPRLILPHALNRPHRPRLRQMHRPLGRNNLHLQPGLKLRPKRHRNTPRLP